MQSFFHPTAYVSSLSTQLSTPPAFSPLLVSLLLPLNWPIPLTSSNPSFLSLCRHHLLSFLFSFSVLYMSVYFGAYRNGINLLVSSRGTWNYTSECTLHSPHSGAQTHFRYVISLHWNKCCISLKLAKFTNILRGYHQRKFTTWTTGVLIVMRETQSNCCNWEEGEIRGRTLEELHASQEHHHILVSKRYKELVIR